MKEFKFVIEGESFEVSVKEENKNRAEVVVNGKSYVVEVERGGTPANKQRNTRQSAAAQTAGGESAKKNTGGSRSIKSPLPGNIFKVPVHVGQSVKRGEALVIIESMKMENDILADRDGTVNAIYVQPGQSVLQGDALVELG